MGIQKVVKLVSKPFLSIGWLLLLVVFSGCQPTLEFEIEDAFNNPRRRPDYKPLYSSQYPPVRQEHPDYFKDFILSTFNDGGPSGDKLQTDLTPLLSGGRDVRDYQNAGCYWLTENDEVKLNWETVFKVRTDELKPEDKYFAACYGRRGGYHPYDNRLPEIDESEFSTSVILPPIVKLEAVTAPHAGDRFNACVNKEPREIRENWTVSDPGPGSSGECAPARTGLRSGCMLEGCSFKVDRDTTFFQSLISPSAGSVDLENSENNTLSEETLTRPRRKMGPDLYSVKTGRTIARPLKLVSEDPSTGKVVYQWETGTLSDGRWEENFSPNLTVLKTRVFVKRGGLILYAKPYRVTVNHLSCFPTDSDFEHDFSILNDCYGTHRTLTPTYLHAAPTNKLLWEFEFQRDPKELGLTETGEEVTGPEGDLFVEFIIVDVNAKIEQALYSSPKNLHFGDVAYTYTKANDVIIQNTSANERLEVQRILIEGFNAKEFEFALNPGVSLPVLLDPNDSLSVRVTAKPLWGALMPQAQSQPTRLRVYAETLNGSIPLETSTQLAAEWVSGPHLYLFPYAEKGMVIEFTRNSLSESEEFIKFFSIHNVGTLPLRREALQIVDRVANSGDAAAFRFVSSRRTGDWTQAYEVQPGTFDDFYIEFIPPEGSQTDFFAEVVITSNDTSDGNRGYGEIRLGLNGVKN